MEELLKRLMKTANAAESCRERNVRHGHPGLVDELFGEEHAPGLRHGDGRRAEVLKEQSSELAFPEPESFGELLYGGSLSVEHSLVNERQGARDGVRGSSPRGELRSCFGAAAQAGTEARLLRCRGGGEKPAIHEVRCAGGADGATVDTGRPHAD